MNKTKFQKPIISISTVLIVALSLICLFAYQLLFRGCLWWECAPKRDFTVLDLDLPDDLFPSGAEIHDLDYLRGDNVAIEAASTTNYWDNGVAIYIVRRFATEAQAIRDYNFDVQVKFTKSFNNNGDYSNIVAFESKIADNSSTQCGYVLNDFRCIYVARYKEFTVFFSGSIGDDEMTEHAFLNVLMYIDDTMKSLLEEGTK